VAAGRPSNRIRALADLEQALRFGEPRHRVHAVHDEIEQHLLQLHAIAEHGRQRRVGAATDRDAARG
jgi:HAMP domain-containing protein